MYARAVRSAPGPEHASRPWPLQVGATRAPAHPRALAGARAPQPLTAVVLGAGKLSRGVLVGAAIRPPGRGRRRVGVCRVGAWAVVAVATRRARGGVRHPVEAWAANCEAGAGGGSRGQRGAMPGSQSRSCVALNLGTRRRMRMQVGCAPCACACACASACACKARGSHAVPRRAAGQRPRERLAGCALTAAAPRDLQRRAGGAALAHGGVARCAACCAAGDERRALRLAHCY